MGWLRVKQVRSTNDRPPEQCRTVEALGLSGIRDTVVHDDTPQIRGMVDKVRHLVDVEEVEEE